LWNLSLMFGCDVPSVSRPDKDEDFPRGIAENLVRPLPVNDPK